MENKNKYPEDIMRIIRQCNGYDKEDTSYDKIINEKSKDEIFSTMCRAYGIARNIQDVPFIKMWIESIYGIELK